MSEKKIYIIISAVTVVLVGLIVMKKNFSHSEKLEAKKQVTLRQVDGYRKQIMQNTKLLKEKVEAENFQQAPSIGHTEAVYKPAFKKNSLEINTQKSHASDVGTDKNVEYRATPKDKINNLLIAKKQYQEMSRLQKKKYIKELRKEAMRLGYKIQLNDQLEVIDMRRLPSSHQKSPVYEGQEFY